MAAPRKGKIKNQNSGSLLATPFVSTAPLLWAGFPISIKTIRTILQLRLPTREILRGGELTVRQASNPG